MHDHEPCRGRPRVGWGRAALAALTLLAASPPLAAAELKPKTLAAWESYIELVERRIDGELASDARFLPDHALDPDERSECRAALEGGDVCIHKLEERDAAGESPEIPKGLVHHWLGMIRIPDVRLDELVAWVQDYDRQAEFFDEVEASDLLKRDGDRFEIRLRLVRQKVITVHYETTHEVIYSHHGEDRVSSRSDATKIAELDDPGSDSEREKPPGDDRGFLWRWRSYWRFRQVGDDLVVACESISLSRSVPSPIRVLFGGMINSVPRESLQRTLTSMRDGVRGEPRSGSGLD